jgi:lysophospholipase L1-like esterase
MRHLLASALLLLPNMLSAQTAPAAPAPPRQKWVDFANFARYAADNTKLPATEPNRVVFMGDSITDNWGRKYGSFFPGKPYINRGIGGQTSPQMVLRFQQDVVNLHPAAVVILAGTNDVAENTGPATDAQVEGNFRAMVGLARANHIRVILASIPPASQFPWHPGIEPAERIRTLNTWLRAFAEEQHLVYLDYYTALATPEGAMKPDLAKDRFVHPNDAGYAVMQPLAEAAIAKSLAQPAP